MDRLAPGELAPGVDKAFDLVLPRAANVDGRFVDEFDVSVHVQPEELANVVRAQADHPDVIVGSERTIFPKLHVRGADAGHHLRVEIWLAPGGAGSKMSVQRVEELPPPLPETNEEAMRKAGLDPTTGAFLDPSHAQ